MLMCYVCLPCQYPFMALAFAAAVGIATGRERSLDNVEVNNLNIFSRFYLLERPF